MSGTPAGPAPGAAPSAQSGKAAPAAVAPAAQPKSAKAAVPAKAGQPQPASSAQPAKAVAKAPVKAKPIPSLPKLKGAPDDARSMRAKLHAEEHGAELPGVELDLPGEEGDQFEPSLMSKLEAQTSTPTAPVAAETAEAAPTVEGEAQPEGEPVIEGEGEGEGEPPLTYEFAGERYRDQAHAEQEFRKARGRASVEANRANELAQITDMWEQAWQDGLAEGVLRPDARRPGQAQGQPQPSRSTAPVVPQPAQGFDPNKPFVDSIPAQQWDALDRIAKEHGIPTALAAMGEMTEGYVKNLVAHHLNQLQSHLQPMIEPAYRAHVQQNNTTKAGEFFSENVAAAVHEDGTPVFPELAKDQQAQQECSQFWLEIYNRLGRDFAFTPEGVKQAYINWRFWRSQRQDQARAATKTATSVVQRAAQHRASAAASAVSGPSAPPPTDGEPLSEGGTLRKMLDRASFRKKSATGFDLGVLPD